MIWPMKVAATLVGSSAMKFQVVLQWPATSMSDFDGMVEIEDLLVEKLSEQCDVDGHDFGSEETNIFVHTHDPLRAFEEIRIILSGHKLWPHARIAYRRVDGTEYAVLWPQGGATTFNVR
jgi:hypothetical protein